MHLEPEPLSRRSMPPIGVCGMTIIDNPYSEASPCEQTAYEAMGRLLKQSTTAYSAAQVLSHRLNTSRINAQVSAMSVNCCEHATELYFSSEMSLIRNPFLQECNVSSCLLLRINASCPAAAVRHLSYADARAANRLRTTHACNGQLPISRRASSFLDCEDVSSQCADDESKKAVSLLNNSHCMTLPTSVLSHRHSPDRVQAAYIESALTMHEGSHQESLDQGYRLASCAATRLDINSDPNYGYSGSLHGCCTGGKSLLRSYFFPDQESRHFTRKDESFAISSKKSSFASPSPFADISA